MAYLPRRFEAVPPEKGSFPLDHDAKCKPQMTVFVSCLKQHKNAHYKCRELSKKYLECRMEENLMQKENLEDYGFDKEIRIKIKEEGLSKEEQGFLGGTTLKPKPK